MNIKVAAFTVSEKYINMASKINLSPPVASAGVLSKAVVLWSLIHFLLLPLLIVCVGVVLVLLYNVYIYT